MGCIKYIRISMLLIFLKMYVCQENNLNSYLKHRYDDVRIELVESFNQFYKNHQDTDTRITIHNMHTFYMPHTPVCFNMLNKTYILMYDQIYTLTITQGAYLFEPHSVLPGVNQKISFVKVAEHKNILLIVTVFTNGYCNVYTYENNEWYFKQTLSKIGMVTDICTFDQDNNLYLFVVYNIRYTSVPAILYHWKDSKFEESDNILTTDATSVSSFENGNSRIIVITQNPIYDLSLIGTYVIEINKGKLRKKQFLDSQRGDKVISYVLNGERYIIVLNNKIDSTIYWWDENHFMKWRHIREPIFYQKIAVYYVQNNPVLFAAIENQLLIYNLQTESVKVISEIPYESYYWKILTIDFALLDDEIIIYVTGLNEENYPEMLLTSVSFEINQINVNTVKDDDTIVKCLLNLNEKLKFRSDLLSHMKVKSEKILQKNQDVTYRGIISSPQEAVAKNNIVHNKYSYSYYDQYAPVKEKLKNLKNEVNIVYQQAKQLTGNVTVKGKLSVENLKISEVNVDRINNYEWDPNKWLLKSKPQIIRSPVKARNVFAKQITTNKNSDLNDLLLTVGDQVLEGPYTFKNLIAQNIFVKNINNIPFEKMCTTKGPNYVTGTKYIQSVSVEKIEATTLNQRTTEDVLHDLQYNVHYNFYNIKSLNVTNFDFDIINGMHWHDFYHSLLNTKNHNEIEGLVIINSNVKIKNLFTKKISNIDVDQIMTTSTDQTITSDMQLMQVNVDGNIVTSNINGLSFKEDVATFYDNNFVSGPVTIKNILVEGNVNGKEFPRQDTNHLLMYEGLVKIEGSLTLTNVTLSPSTTVMHKDKQLYYNFMDEYWLKNKKQIISEEITALNGVTVKSLNTTYINGKSFVLFSENFNKDEDFVYQFENIRVNGNVILHSDTKMENLERIFRQGVKKTGGRYKIKGQKVFKNTLKINNLNTAVVDNTIVDNVAKRNKFNKIIGTKTFKNLIIQDDLILPPNYKLKIREINNILLTDMLNRTIYIDRDSYVSNLIFKNEIETTNVIAKNINGENVDNMTVKVMNLWGMDKLEKVTISGDMKIENLETKNVNNINIDDYFSQLVYEHDNIIINGDMNFKNNLYIKNLIVDSINGRDLTKISENYLLRHEDQIISGIYEINNVETPFIDTPEINNIKTDSLIDITSTEDIRIHSNVEISNLNCDSANSKHFNFDLEEAAHNLFNLPGHHWSDVTVLNDITFKKTEGNVGRLLTKAVNALNNNTINQEVIFNSMHAKKIDLLTSKINGVNIKKLYDDALKNNEDNQIVTGKNRFSKLSAARMKIVGNTNIRNINGVDIIELNNTIIDQKHLGSSIIRGHKQFTKNITITNLKIPSKIHGVSPENLVEIHKKYDVAPNVRFKKLKILENCNFDLIKFVNITKLISQTLKCNISTPQYVKAKLIFKNVVLSGNVTTSTINNIDVRNVVVDHGIQQINSPKAFDSPVNIVGNFNVELINGYRLSKVYENAVLSSKDAIFENDVILKKPARMLANIKCNKINGIEVERLKRILEDSESMKTNVTIAAVDELRKIVDYYSPHLIDNGYDYKKDKYQKTNLDSYYREAEDLEEV